MVVTLEKIAQQKFDGYGVPELIKNDIIQV